MAAASAGAEGRPVHLLHVFSTLAVGGPQRRFVTTVDGLGEHYRHTVVAMDGRYDAIKLIEHTKLVSVRPVPVCKGAALSSTNLRVFRQTLREVSPDLLVTYNWGTIEWAVANRVSSFCPHLHLEDGFGPEETGGRQLARRVWMRRLALSGNGTRLIVPSQTLRSIARNQWRFRDERIIYIPNGIDCSALAASAAQGRQARDHRDSSVVIGTIATLRREKNICRLLRTFASLPKLPATKLIVAGDGPIRTELEDEARRLDLCERVLFTGFVADPGTLLGACDIFALSSDTEQMPYSVLEAMACGLPIVATDVGDVAALLSEANRDFVAPPGDEVAFTKHMKVLLSDPSRRDELGKANAIRANARFDMSAMLTCYEHTFRAMIRSVRPTPA